MKTTIGLFAIILFTLGHNAAFAGESKLEERAYREIAQFLKVRPKVVRDQQELSVKIEQIVPIGTIKAEAFKKLRKFLAAPPRSIRLDWEFERNPGGVTVTFVDGNQGFSIVIVLKFDQAERVAGIRTGEFVH